MPNPAPDWPTIYAHRLQLERGIRAYLIDCGFVEGEVWTSETMWSATKGKPDFQYPRPRIMIEFQKGDSVKRWINDNDGNRRLNGWNGTVTFTALTAAETDVHTAYLAKLTAAVGFLDNDLCNNVDALPYHEISQVWDNGESDLLKSEEGNFMTKLVYGIFFGWRPDTLPVAGTAVV